MNFFGCLLTINASKLFGEDMLLAPDTLDSGD